MKLAQGTHEALTMLRSSRQETITEAMENFMASEEEAAVIIERALMTNYGVRSRIPYEKNRLEDKRVVDPQGEAWCDDVIKWIAFKVRSLSFLKCTEGLQGDPITGTVFKPAKLRREFKDGQTRQQTEILYTCDEEPTKVFRKKHWLIDDDGSSFD